MNLEEDENNVTEKPPMKSGTNAESLTPLKMSGTNARKLMSDPSAKGLEPTKSGTIAESLTPLQKVCHQRSLALLQIV